jgi:hypothetical protein
MRFTLTASLLLLVLTSSSCDSLKESFMQNFDKSFMDSCRTEAVKRGASQQDAQKYCDCTLVKFKETKSMEEAAKTCIANLKLSPQH